MTQDTEIEEAPEVVIARLQAGRRIAFENANTLLKKGMQGEVSRLRAVARATDESLRQYDGNADAPAVVGPLSTVYEAVCERLAEINAATKG